MPKISVIIPCYNRGHLINDAVDSVLLQTFDDVEIIIVNDGSTDELTNKVLSNYDKPKTKVIHTPNCGPGHARNVGYENSTGEFIQFLDSDDVILTSKFEKQLEIFNKNPSFSVCYTDFSFFDIRTSKTYEHQLSKFLGDDPIYDFIMRWERGLTIPIHAALFRRSVWIDYLPFEPELFAKEDWLMWCKLAINGNKFYFLDKKLVYYRMHDSNMCIDRSEMDKQLVFATYYIFNRLPEKYKLGFLEESNRMLRYKNFESLNAENYSLKQKYEDLNKKYEAIKASKTFKIGKFIIYPFQLLKRSFRFK